jgi:transposase
LFHPIRHLLIIAPIAAQRQALLAERLRQRRPHHLIKIVWHDGIGMSLYAKRLERGRFIWPSQADGIVAISASQLAYMLDGIDWRNPVRTWRPELAG